MQAPLYQKILLKENKTFNILKVKRPYFAVPWHTHPEIEIMLVVQGKGTRFVGDNIEPFSPLDLVMAGSRLPHVWKNSSEHYEEGSELVAEARVILFTEDCFGKDFFLKPEMAKVKDLCVRAQRGLKFVGETRQRAAEKILASCEKDGVQQVIAFLSILDDLANSEECRSLSSIGYNQKAEAADEKRLNNVLDYLAKNFTGEIRLEDVANIANMSPTAFCRYFKSRTNKSVIQFTNELRISLAHKLLVDTRATVDQVSSQCGFNNLSNFYEQFQKLTGRSPFKYRKEHNQKSLAASFSERIIDNSLLRKFSNG